MTKKRTGLIIRMSALLIALAVAAVIFTNFNYIFSESLFAKEHAFDGPSGVFAGASGRTYVIDEGKKKVLALNEAGELEFIINGGSRDDVFYYASQIADDESGNIYIADANYLGTGTIVESERVIMFSSKGKEPVTVFEKTYDAANAPKQYGRIKHIEVANGTLVLASSDKSKITVTRYDINSKSESITEYDAGSVNLSDVTVYGENHTPVFITRSGQIGSFDESKRPYFINDNAGTAWQAAVDGGYIYYTELSSGAVMRMDFNGSVEAFFAAEGTMLSTIDSKNGVIVSTDNTGCFNVSSGDAQGFFAAPFSNNGARIAAYVMLLIAAAIAIELLIRGIVFIAKRMNTETAKRISIAIVVSVCVAATVSYTILSTLIVSQSAMVMQEINLFGDMMTDRIDVDRLTAVDDISDYQGEDYTAVKSALDKMVDMAYENGSYYYYGIYMTDKETVYAVMDYEDTVTSRHPFYPYDPENDGYSYVLDSGEPAEVSAEVSSYGSWSFALKPVFDKNNNVVASIEVGVNLDEQRQAQKELIVEVILTVFSVTAVLVMMVIEGIFFIKYKSEKLARAGKPVGGVPVFPLRTLIFIAFLADCMQDAFVSILANSLYEPIFGIPSSVGAALPLSAQVLMVALLALAGGSIVGRIGVKKTLAAGYILQILGFVGCAAFGTYAGLLIGKAVIGAGLGLVVVSLNTVAAVNTDEAESASGFSDISAGTLAGVSVGSGVGSIILAWGSYSMVYYAGAAILAVGLLIAITGPELKSRRAKVKADKASIGVLRFMMDRRAFSFLLFILLPFMIAISFREYLFPIYAENMGISESDIGRLYLLFGIFIIYAGPVLTKTLIEKFGTKVTMVISTCFVAAGTLLFAFVQNVPTAIIGVLLISVATSFGYAVQSTHYSAIPAVGEYGEGKAMGIYSLFDNGGQTLGPVIYGLALILGYRNGLIAIGGSFTVLLLLFLVFNVKNGKKSGKES